MSVVKTNAEMSRFRISTIVNTLLFQFPTYVIVINQRHRQADRGHYNASHGKMYHANTVRPT